MATYLAKWIEHKSVADIKPIKVTQDSAIETFIEGVDIVHRVFLAAGRDLWDSFASDAKKQLLAGLHGDEKIANWILPRAIGLTNSLKHAKKPDPGWGSGLEANRYSAEVAWRFCAGFLAAKRCCTSAMAEASSATVSRISRK